VKKNSDDKFESALTPLQLEKSNHRKAVIFINISSFIQAICLSLVKYMTTVAPFDDF